MLLSTCESHCSQQMASVDAGAAASPVTQRGYSMQPDANTDAVHEPEGREGNRKSMAQRLPWLAARKPSRFQLMSGEDADAEHHAMPDVLPTGQICPRKARAVCTAVCIGVVWSIFATFTASAEHPMTLGPLVLPDEHWRPSTPPTSARHPMTPSSVVPAPATSSSQVPMPSPSVALSGLKKNSPSLPLAPPSPPPSVPPPLLCMEWCASHSQLWARKCTFHKCAICAPCLVPPPPTLPPQPPMSPLPPKAPPMPPSSPPLPPSAPPSAAALITMLNRRFEMGHPTNDLSKAGVLLRQFDHQSEWDSGRPWLACSAQSWCYHLRAFWPASIVSAKVRALYYRSRWGQPRGGLILAPSAHILCVYPGDGNSMGSFESNGCPKSDDEYCIKTTDPWACVYDKDHLKEALQAQQNWAIGSHNEVVLNTSSITPAQLPWSILAFFHEGDISTVRPLHQAFLHSFSLIETECPLLSLNLRGPGDAFSLTP